MMRVSISACLHLTSAHSLTLSPMFRLEFTHAPTVRIASVQSEKQSDLSKHKEKRNSQPKYLMQCVGKQLKTIQNSSCLARNKVASFAKMNLNVNFVSFPDTTPNMKHTTAAVMVSILPTLPYKFVCGGIVQGAMTSSSKTDGTHCACAQNIV